MTYKIGELRIQQDEIAKQASLTNKYSSLRDIKTVGAADISSNRFAQIGYAAVMVFSYPDLTLLDQTTYSGILPLPYIPGYLSFREAPLIQTCLDKLKVKPDVLVCDGQGIAHPRRCGIATYIGVQNNMVTVGCGKSRLVGEYQEPGIEKASRSDLMLNGDKIGEVVRTRDAVKPLYISPGHQITFEMATTLILSLCTKYRQPEPIRAVHHLVNEIRIKANEKVASRKKTVIM